MTSLLPNVSVETISVKRLTLHTKIPYAQVLDRFRTLAPRIDLAALRAQTSAEGIEDVVRSTGTPTGFVIFTEFDHGRWIAFFPPFSNESSSPDAGGDGSSITPAREIHRIIFGNPLFAITMLRESLEAALHVPLDCSLVEQEDGSTRLVMLLPELLVASHAAVRDRRELRRAASELEDKIYRLIEAIQKDGDF